MAVPEDETRPEDEQEQQTEATEPEEEAPGATGSEEAPGAGDGEKHEQAEKDAEPVDELQQARREVAEYKDMALRAQAEVQNLQRRTARDVQNAHKYALEKFLRNLLPIVDSLEKAVEAAEQAAASEDDPMLEGVQLCNKLLVDLLAREGIEAIDPVGEPFDPNEQQAISIVDNPEMEPNSVSAVVQKGYRLNGRLVRAAMVMVTGSPPGGEEQEDPEA